MFFGDFSCPFFPFANRICWITAGKSACNFVYVIGDAYVDLPSFGHVITSQIFENLGYMLQHRHRFSKELL